MSQHPLRQMASACLLHARLFTLEAHRALTLLAYCASMLADFHCGPHGIVVAASIALACFLTLFFREWLHHEMMIALRKRRWDAIDHAWYQPHTAQAPLADCPTQIEGPRTAVVTCCRTVRT